MRVIRSLLAERPEGLATIEYVVGAAIVMGTLAAGMSAWNTGLATRLQTLVTQLQAVH